MRRLRGPAGALGMIAVLFFGGGGGLIATAVMGGTAGADASGLGGFTVSSLAEAFTAQYEQPNFPLPATPTLEFDVGYADSTDNFGPTGSATASTLYPGQVVANAGPELALLVPGIPVPPAPVWPLEAVTDYPQTPNTKTLDEPGANMDASSTTDGSQATSTVGDDAATAGGNGTQPAQAPSGSGNPFASTSSLFGIGNASGTSSSTTDASGLATATATATDSGISILDGFINIGAVTSTATATSDGTTGKVSGSTTLGNVTIAGETVQIGASGLQVLGKSVPLALPIAALNTLLNELGVSISVTNATDKVSGAQASRELDGVRISINVTTLDNVANKLAGLLPKQLTSALPIALPSSQVITLDLGTVSVSSAASPSFTSDDTGSSDAGSSDTGTGSSSDLGTGSTSFPSTGSSFASPSSSFPTSTGSVTPTPATTTTGGAAPTTGNSFPTSAVSAAFGGVGSGLILLGVLAAAAMAYVYKRADDASELVGAACADGDPLGARFSDDDGTDAGGA